MCRAGAGVEYLVKHINGIFGNQQPTHTHAHPLAYEVNLAQILEESVLQHASDWPWAVALAYASVALTAVNAAGASRKTTQ